MPGMSLWNATATFLRAHQRKPSLRPSQAEAPGQQFLYHPGKLVVGDDLYPLGLHPAKYNLMNSPDSWLRLFSPREALAGDQHLVLCEFPPLTLLTNTASSRPHLPRTRSVSARTGETCQLL